MKRSVRSTTVIVLSAIILGGCSGGESAEEASDDTAPASTASQETPAAAVASTAATTAEASMTVADIDRWQKGMVAELAAVRDAGSQLKAAKSANDTISAMMAANEISTRAAGARGAGIDENRYGLIASTLSAVVRYMVPLDVDMDVRQMPVEMKQAMTADREQSFTRISASYPKEVIDALRPRAAELRRQELALVGERLKAAGMAP